MKIFPIRPMSNYDRAKILIDILGQNRALMKSSDNTVQLANKPSKTFSLRQLIDSLKSCTRGIK